MRQIIVYQSEDGSRWDRQDDALKRDAMYARTKAAESPLSTKPRLEGREFFQHDVSAVASVRRDYERLAREYFGTTNGRVVADSDNPVASLMYRLESIDAQGREWQQIYYAINTPHNPRRVNQE